MYLPRYAMLAVLLIGYAGSASAQQMNAQKFYKRAVALKAKGPFALFSGGEIRRLTTEGQAAGNAAAARYHEDKKAGRPTRFCPPAGPAKMASSEFLGRLAQIPVTDRARIDLTEATTRIMAAKFPCSIGR